MRQWSLIEREKQRQLIQNWKPWHRATGAKTAAGKAKSKLNAFKHGLYSAEMKETFRLLADSRRILKVLHHLKIETF